MDLSAVVLNLWGAFPGPRTSGSYILIVADIVPFNRGASHAQFRALAIVGFEAAGRRRPGCPSRYHSQLKTRTGRSSELAGSPQFGCPFRFCTTGFIAASH